MKRYGVILADPPWSYRVGESTRKRGTASGQYQTMTDADICALRIDGREMRHVAADDAVLLLWATWPKLREALDVVEAWGFSYVTGLPWVKIVGEPVPNLFGELGARPAYGVGFWFRGASEPILVARRGNVAPPYQEGMVGLLCERMAHSRKPDNLHEVAETMPGPYLELFARRPRAGWDLWGAEAPAR